MNWKQDAKREFSFLFADTTDEERNQNDAEELYNKYHQTRNDDQVERVRLDVVDDNRRAAIFVFGCRIVGAAFFALNCRQIFNIVCSATFEHFGHGQEQRTSLVVFIDWHARIDQILYGRIEVLFELVFKRGRVDEQNDEANSVRQKEQHQDDCVRDKKEAIVELGTNKAWYGHNDYKCTQDE